ncbi:hypothetical protein CSQ96_27590 [Janthinobacterium sp. BJB412]|nr:hypothetical protein CSQ96_27590 [Janthinobacterium sp. BJB412]
MVTRQQTVAERPFCFLRTQKLTGDSAKNRLHGASSVPSLQATGPQTLANVQQTRLSTWALRGPSPRHLSPPPPKPVIEHLPRATIFLPQETHTPGERLFIDYAGQTLGVTDGSTGEIRSAQVFVAVLGASNYTYIEATWSQQLPDWIGSHVRAFAFFAAAPSCGCPTTCAAVSRRPRATSQTSPPTYHDLAEHYGVAVLPARARRPKDKAKVENGVPVVTRWVLARLRHQRFFSLNELNRSLRTLLTDLNQRPFNKLPGSRASAFAEMDQPALRALPEQHYEYAEWKVARVGVDYHVEVDGHYYSVPCQHSRAQMDVRMTRSTVEVFLRGQRIASHAQCAFKRRHTTVAAHMPPAHREVAGWNAQTLTARAEAGGPRCALLMERLLRQRQHLQQAFRSCLGVLSLGQKYGIGRLEAACARAPGKTVLLGQFLSFFQRPDGAWVSFGHPHTSVIVKPLQTSASYLAQVTSDVAEVPTWRCNCLRASFNLFLVNP